MNPEMAVVLPGWNPGRIQVTIYGRHFTTGTGGWTVPESLTAYVSFGSFG